MARVVVIDDSKDMRDTLRMVLELEDHEVVEAASGQEALALELQPTDVVILDGRLPGMSGLAILERIRERPEAPAVIMCSASVDETEQEAALAAGAHAFVTKPFDVVELLRMIDELAASN